MTSPNVNASPESVANELDGIDGNGNELPFRKVAMFYDAHMFGLPTDYAFPEGSNETASAVNHITSLAKLLTRKQKLADGNDYDAWDCLFTITKYVLSQAPHINDNEVLSVNYKKPAS
ncbi:hypothetical protein [Mycobacterium intracellulare]|uniref:hypothetical protein n=1 Tax=Mycobacterium intracellulare TaxID=1767 RepID=UPI00109E3B12|nr:hypothetical protein [Mycobacterium intracellulare]